MMARRLRTVAALLALVAAAGHQLIGVYSELRTENPQRRVLDLRDAEKRTAFAPGIDGWLEFTIPANRPPLRFVSRRREGRERAAVDSRSAAPHTRR